jgi:hypothetical protein
MTVKSSAHELQASLLLGKLVGDFSFRTQLFDFFGHLLKKLEFESSLLNPAPQPQRLPISQRQTALGSLQQSVSPPAAVLVPAQSQLNSGDLRGVGGNHNDALLIGHGICLPAPGLQHVSFVERGYR